MKIIKILTLFAAFALIFGCDSGDEVTYTSAENSASVTLSAASNPLGGGLSLQTGEAAEVALKAVDEYGDPLAGAQVIFLDSEGVIIFDYTADVTDASGNLTFSVTADTNYFEEKTGEIVVRVTDGRSSGRAVIKYNIAPWSGELWSDGLEVNASLMPGIYEHTTEIALPKGLEIASVSPLELGSSVNVSVIKDNSALSFTAYSSATEGVETLSVKLKGGSVYNIPVNIVVRDGSADKPFPINSVSELRALAENSPFNSYTYILENDMDLSGVNWRPIDNFTGTVDGNGHSIIIGAPFASVISPRGAVFKNIRFVSSDNATPVRQLASVYAAANAYFGGLIAMDAHSLTLENVLIEGGYRFESTLTGAKYLGLAVGVVRKLNADNVTVKGYLDIAAPVAHAGLLAGSIGGDGANAPTAAPPLIAFSTARNITVEGRIDARLITASTTNTLTGGIAGRAIGLNISNCAVRADITWNSPANYGGGLIGELAQYNSIDRCYFAGNFISDNATSTVARYLGGLVGSVLASGTGSIISDSYSAGTLTLSGAAGAASYAGGIVGYNVARIYILNTYSSAGVDSIAYAGGLSGYSITTGENTAYVSHSAAMNSYIYGLTVARIGNNLYEDSAGNYSYRELLIKPGSADEGSLKDGVSVSGLDAEKPEFFINTVGFSPDIWDTDYSSRGYKLPILKGLGEEQKNFPN
jgi:hypothetical protein